MVIFTAEYYTQTLCDLNFIELEITFYYILNFLKHVVNGQTDIHAYRAAIALKLN